MGKSQFPMVSQSSGILRRAVGFLLAISAVVLVIKYPADSAHWLSNAVIGLVSVIDGLVTFFRELAG